MTWPPASTIFVVGRTILTISAVDPIAASFFSTIARAVAHGRRGSTVEIRAFTRINVGIVNLPPPRISSAAYSLGTVKESTAEDPRITQMITRETRAGISYQYPPNILAPTKTSTTASP